MLFEFEVYDKETGALLRTLLAHTEQECYLIAKLMTGKDIRVKKAR